MQNLDKTITREYNIAMDVFPELVQKETPILHFWRTEDGHPERTAHRLALHWKYRKDLFQGRWLLPLTMTGKGALQRPEMEMLHTGYAMPLLRPGRGLVLWCDSSRVATFDITAHFRNILYLCTVFTDEYTQTHGATVVYVVRAGDHLASYVEPAGFDIVRNAGAMKIQQVLVTQAYEPGLETNVLDFLAEQASRTVEFRTQRQAHKLACSSLVETRRMMQAFGIECPYLPTSLGGDFDYKQQLPCWIRMRKSLEAFMSSPRQSMLLRQLQGDDGAVHCSQQLQQQHCKGSSSNNNNKGMMDLQSRHANAMSSRRHYYKRKLEALSLEEKLRLLRIEQKRLKEESERLEGLLYMAQQIVGNTVL